MELPTTQEIKGYVCGLPAGPEGGEHPGAEGLDKELRAGDSGKG